MISLFVFNPFGLGTFISFIFETTNIKIMRATFYLFLAALFLIACERGSKQFKLQYEHQDVLYTDKASIKDFEIQQDIYVPAYSDIYYETENKKTYLTVILSLRNISFDDTLYFDRINYYGSSGKLIREYIDKVLVLRPMESMEYIVRAADKEGGAGANFVVSYRAKSNLKNHPYIESVMMGNLDNYRFSFSSPGVPVNN